MSVAITKSLAQEILFGIYAQLRSYTGFILKHLCTIYLTNVTV